MLRDITIGQYFPGHSFIHKMDPRMKLIAAVLYIIVLFVASRPLGMALGIALVVFNDTTRHSTYISTTMTSDFSFITHTT